MSRFLVVLIVGVFTIGASQALPGSALAESKQSGAVVAAGPSGDTLTIEVMGPWLSERQAPEKRTVILSPQTSVALAGRSESESASSPADWPGGFKERPMTAADIRPGDLVTVTADERGGRLHATSVTVVRPEGDVSASPAMTPSSPSKAAPAPSRLRELPPAPDSK